MGREYRLVATRVYSPSGTGNRVYQSRGAAERSQKVNGGTLQSREVGEWESEAEGGD